jgi:threonine aldolase
MVGGGMRQAGVLAAAGIVALEEMVDRLAEDHANARALAEGIAGLPGVYVDLSAVQTNIVVVELRRPDMTGLEFIRRMNELGVKTTDFGANLVRMVTHYGITRSDVEKTVGAAKQLLRG